MRMRMFFLASILLFVGGKMLAQAPVQAIQPEGKKTKSDVRKNVELYLVKIGWVEFWDVVEIVYEKPDRLFVRDISDGKIIKTLESDPINWIEGKKKRFFNNFGHKGATRNWRYARSPSLNINKVQHEKWGELLEIDIDEHRGREHLIKEVIPHFAKRRVQVFGLKIFFFLPKSTSQKSIANQLARWK